jgi:hypothetical protein
MTKLEHDIDDLFKLPLNEFIEARKALAAGLKKSGNSIDAERVKLLAKPSLSVWAVNQLYWNHREPFDELMASGQRFRKAQTSGKIPEMRDALDARREALAQLSSFATDVLSDAGNNPALDTLRRITSTLEAVSAYASLEGQTLGRLTKDVDPPGFESFASSIPGPTTISGATTKSGKSTGDVKPAKQRSADAKKAPPKSSGRLEEARSVKLAAAKLSLQTAKRTLTAARANAQSLELQQKKADAVVKEAGKRQREAEKESRDAEARLKKASSTAEDANRRAQTVRDQAEEAKKSLADAQRTVDDATGELESLFRSSR